MVALNLYYMAKSKTKTDYIQELLHLTHCYAHKLTVKQIRTLIAKYALS